MLDGKYCNKKKDTPFCVANLKQNILENTFNVLQYLNIQFKVLIIKVYYNQLLFLLQNVL